MSRIFGTDGVRGVANADLTPELAFKIGRATAKAIAAAADAHLPIVVGRDTRLSGTMLEAALVSGIASTGRDTLSLGVVPTPAVARVTVATGAAAGIVISASHNPIEDNGIKIFAADGFKLSDAEEDALENEIAVDTAPRPTHRDVGIARSAPELADRYVERVVGSGADLSALTIVVDAAYGAAYRLGPRILSALGATVEAMHAEDDGARINVACGSTDMSALVARVRERARESPRAHVLGVAFDGDADRALFVDENGEIKNGDHAMFVLAVEKKRRGELARDTVVGTVMSNVGLERALSAEGIVLVRAAVGDRYVLERMRADGYAFGGEQSGHVIDLARNTTGDGPAAAVALFTAVVRNESTLAALGAPLRIAPQVLVNVRTPNKAVLGDATVRDAIARVERELAADGRLLVRASGTEPLIRVMIEGDDQQRIDRLAHELAEIVARSAR